MKQYGEVFLRAQFFSCISLWNDLAMYVLHFPCVVTIDFYAWLTVAELFTNT
jgi:hypothetical protein